MWLSFSVRSKKQSSYSSIMNKKIILVFVAVGIFSIEGIVSIKNVLWISGPPLPRRYGAYFHSDSFTPRKSNNSPLEYLLILILTVGKQDQTVLRNVYKQIQGWNRSLKKDTRMEELAQHFSCVRSHSVHSGSPQDKEILRKYWNVGSIIACVGGCREIYSNWSREKPAQIWYEFRTRTGHYNAIMKNNRVGCSAAVSGQDYCVFCYLAKERLASDSSDTDYGQETMDNISWDTNSARRESLTLTFLSIWLCLFVFFGQ